MTGPRPLESLDPAPAEAGKWVYGKDLVTMLDCRIPVAAAGGVAPLDEGARLPISCLPAGLMTNPMTAAGDMIAGGEDGAAVRVPVGENGKVWMVHEGVPGWGTPPSSGFANPMTTAGDQIVGGASGAPARVAVGEDGQVWMVVSGVPGWAAAPSGGGGMSNPMTTAGDIICGGASGAPTRLAKGANGTYLEMGATNPAWVAKIFNWTSHTTSPNNTIPVRRLVPASGANVDVAITPTGTGSLLARVPDNATAGGNKRGAQAVDLSLVRVAADEVASGDYAVAIGNRTKASGTYGVAIGYNAYAVGSPAYFGGVAIGYSAYASGNYGGGVAIGFLANAESADGGCIAIGQSASAMSSAGSVAIGLNASAYGAHGTAVGSQTIADAYSSTALGAKAMTHGRQGLHAFGSGVQAENNIVQSVRWHGYTKTTDATPVKVGANAAVGDASNVTYSLPPGFAGLVSVKVLAKQTAGADAGTIDGWTGTVLLHNNAGTTAAVGGTALTKIGSSGFAATAAVDDSIDALVVTVTGQASKVVEWRVFIDGVEG